MLGLRVGHLARPIPRQVVKSLGPRGGMRSPRGAPHAMHGSFPTGAGSVPITGHEPLAGPGSPGVRLWSRFASEARNWGFRPNVLVLIMDSSQATGLSQTIHYAFDLPLPFLRGSAILGLCCQFRLNLGRVHSCASQLQGINPESPTAFAGMVLGIPPFEGVRVSAFRSVIS